jgi:hypothetical protein
VETDPDQRAVGAEDVRQHPRALGPKVVVADGKGAKGFVGAQCFCEEYLGGGCVGRKCEEEVWGRCVGRGREEGARKGACGGHRRRDEEEIGEQERRRYELDSRKEEEEGRKVGE